MKFRGSLCRPGGLSEQTSTRIFPQFISLVMSECSSPIRSVQASGRKVRMSSKLNDDGVARRKRQSLGSSRVEESSGKTNVGGRRVV
ncbi:hypothetical protein NEUTE2DRAFT_77557, partial [Neurospora tetrasperma FGSC 2509]